MTLVTDLLNLLFPRNCAGCSAELANNENSICTSCLIHLPKTDYWNQVDNPVARIFWGRVKLENAATLYHFQKGGRLQEIMHNLKYKGMKEIGFELGQIFGHLLKETNYANANVLIPVPLHVSRIRKRGYNQSEEIAKGIADTLKIETDCTSVKRHIANDSQTKKNRFDRWSNVENIFEVITPQQIAGKHILLVDDILTTGATLEACAAQILEVADTKVSIVALACADIN